MSIFLRDNKDQARITLLYDAIYFNHFEIFKILLSHPDIDVNLVDTTNNKTPLMWCCGYPYDGHSYSRDALLDLILKHPDLDATAKPKCGYTCIWMVCKEGLNLPLKRLIASGVDLGDVEHELCEDDRAYPIPTGLCTAREIALRKGHAWIAKFFP